MNYLHLLVLTNSTFAFAGGTDADFVNALATETKAPAIIFARSDRKWPAMKFQYSDDTSLKRGIVARMKNLVVITRENAVYSSAWPEFFYRKQAVSLYTQGFRSIRLPGAEESEEPLKIKMRWPEAIAVQQLQHDVKGVFLDTHWFYREARVIPSDGTWERSKLRSLTTAAVGAELMTSHPTTLNISPKEFRKRVVAMHQSAKRPSEMQDSEVDDYYRAEIFKELTDQQIRDLYKQQSPVQILRIPIRRGTALQAAADARVTVRTSAQRIAATPSSKAIAELLHRNYDLSIPTEAKVRSDGVVRQVFFSTNRKERLHF